MVTWLASSSNEDPNTVASFAGVENVVVVDNIPVVEPARFEKLNGIIRRFFGACGKIVNAVYPKDHEVKTKGFAFLEYENSESAMEAAKQ